MMSPSATSACPVAPTFFAIFLFREEAAAAVAETMQLELLTAARAAMAKTENFMVVVVGYVVVLLIIIDLREFQFYVSSTYRILSIFLHSFTLYCSAKIEFVDPGSAREK